MYESKRNKYKTGTPEWQLYESLISQMRIETSCIEKVKCYQIKAARAREQVRLHVEALIKLDPDFNID